MSINYFAVVGATAAAAAAGALWYSPFLFGKAWAREKGLEEAHIQRRHPAVVYGGAILLNLLTAVMLAICIGSHGNAMAGIAPSLVICLAWVTPAIGINHLAEGRSWKFLAITVGYHLLRFGLMGFILGLWG